MKNLETADMEITFYGYEVIFNAIEYAWIFVKKRLLDVFLSGFCPEFSKNRYPLLSDKDKTDLSGLSVSLSADV